MSDEASAEGLVLGWRSSGIYYRAAVVVPKANENPKVRERFLKTLKLQTAADFMEALVKHG